MNAPLLLYWIQCTIKHTAARFQFNSNKHDSKSSLHANDVQCPLDLLCGYSALPGRRAHSTLNHHLTNASKGIIQAKTCYDCPYPSRNSSTGILQQRQYNNPRLRKTHAAWQQTVWYSTLAAAVKGPMQWQVFPPEMRGQKSSQQQDRSNGYGSSVA